MDPLYQIIATTGKFDPLWPRDLLFLEYARSLGDELVVLLYNDYRISHHNGALSIVGKKEYTRIHELEALPYVDVVILTQHGHDFRYAPFTKNIKELDFTVGYELEQLKPRLFITNSRETMTLNKSVCDELNIKMKFSTMGEYEEWHEKRQTQK